VPGVSGEKDYTITFSNLPTSGIEKGEIQFEVKTTEGSVTFAGGTTRTWIGYEPSFNKVGVYRISYWCDSTDVYLTYEAGPESQISDTAYNATTWDGVTDEAPSKNAVRDKFESLSSGGLIPISKTTAANDSAIDISLTGGYTKYRIVFERINQVEASSRNLQMRISIDGGTAFISTTTYSVRYYQMVGTTGSFSDTSWTIMVGIGGADADKGYGHVDLYLADGTDSNHLVGLTGVDASSSMNGAMMSHAQDSTTAATDVRFFMNSGNIEDGVFHLYGIVDGDA